MSTMATMREHLHESVAFFARPTVKMLVPCDLAVDANRDGVIKFAGNYNSTNPNLAGKPQDKTTQDNPFRFWINDDQDTDNGDVVPPTQTDSDPSAGLTVIESKRDLEDFARIWMWFGGLQDAIAAKNIQVGLKWRNTEGTHPAINVFLAAASDGSDSYLKSDTAAEAQLAGSAALCMGRIASTNPIILPTVSGGPPNGIYPFWDGLSEASPYKYLLFEGVSEGKGELVMTFHDKDGNEIGEGPGVWLDLKNIKKMYQRGKAQPENIAPPQESASGPFNGPVESIDDDTITFEADPNEEKKAMIFVHGWSMDYPNYLSFSETMFKRMWHQGFKGRFCSFRWDPLVAGGLYAGEYNRSEHRAFVYGGALKQFAEGVEGEGFSVSLAGHSMGNIVCSSALQQGLTVQNYLLMEAAVPAGCYDESGGRETGGVNGYEDFWDAEDTEPTPDYHQVPNGDLTKGYRGFFNSIGNNAGRVVNFHNLDDFALAAGTTFGFETNWEKNEIDFKPDGNGATVWRYFYFPDRPLEERARLRVNSLNGRDVTDSYEIKAFVARPRSKAVGAVDASLGNLPSGAIQENINLQDYDFDARDSDHSGQFNRCVQDVDELYRDIHDIVK